MVRTVFLVMGVMSVVMPSTACGSPERIAANAFSVAPMDELSGLAIARTPSGDELLAVGDESYDLLVLKLVGGEKTLDWSKAYKVPLPVPRQPGGSEFEGVTVDAAGRVVVVAERGEVLAFEMSADRRTATLVSTRPIVFPARHPLAVAWRDAPNSRAEGIAFVGERLFIVKQRDPAALIELVVRGDGYEAAGSWPLSDLDDASELVHDKGVLVIVGARSNKLCEFEVPAADKVGALACKRSWELPARLGDKGKARWEGLAFAADGSAVLAVDTKKSDRPNVTILPPLPGR